MTLDALIKFAAAAGAAEFAEAMGLTAGTISQRKARDLYGKWFTKAVSDGRLHPARIENGRGGAKKYRIADILSLRTADAARAELKPINTITK